MHRIWEASGQPARSDQFLFSLFRFAARGTTTQCKNSVFLFFVVLKPPGCFLLASVQFSSPSHSLRSTRKPKNPKTKNKKQKTKNKKNKNNNAPGPLCHLFEKKLRFLRQLVKHQSIEKGSESHILTARETV